MSFNNWGECLSDGIPCTPNKQSNRLRQEVSIAPFCLIQMGQKYLPSFGVEITAASPIRPMSRPFRVRHIDTNQGKRSPIGQLDRRPESPCTIPRTAPD